MIVPRWISHSQPTSSENRRCCLGNRRIAARQLFSRSRGHTNNLERTFCRNAIGHRKIFDVTLANDIHVADATDGRLRGETTAAKHDSAEVKTSKSQML